MAGEGLVVMTPSSIAVTGSGSETGTINDNGSVSFASCYKIRFDGVFTSDYTNYMIVTRIYTDTNQEWAHFRFSSSGSEVSDGNYNHQYLNVNNASISAARVNADTKWRIDNFDNDVAAGGLTMYLANPAVAANAMFRSVTVNSYAGARFSDQTGNRNPETTTYDGFALFPEDAASSTITGNLTVFGYEE